MRRAFACMLALVLGTACAILVACGGDARGLIGSSDADAMQQQLDQIESSVRRGQCGGLPGELARPPAAGQRAAEPRRRRPAPAPAGGSREPRADLAGPLRDPGGEVGHRADHHDADDADHAHRDDAHDADRDGAHDADRDGPDADDADDDPDDPARDRAAAHDHRRLRRRDRPRQHRRRRRRRDGRRGGDAMTGGTEIAGRYRIEGRLGLGGMSTVHLATDTRLERHVAIKLLAEHLADDPTFVSRFQREALSAAKLVHPNVVQVFDSGLDPASGRHFIVMEYVPGQSLAQLLRERPQLDVAGDARHRRPGLPRARLRAPPGRRAPRRQARQPAHHAGRDRQARRLRDRAGDRPVVDHAGGLRARHGRLPGARAGGRRGGRAPGDLYSLGVVTYQCLAGRLPYEAASLSELVLKQQREVPPPLDRLRGDVNPALASAVAVALSIHPRARYEARGRWARRSTGRRGHRARGGDRGDGLHGRHRGDLGARRPRPRRRHQRAPRVVPREPVNRRARAGAGPRARRRPHAARGAAARKRQRRRRTLAVLLVLALIGAGVGIAIVSSMSDSQRVQLRGVVYDSVQQSVDAMKQLVSDNTK